MSSLAPQVVLLITWTRLTAFHCSICGRVALDVHLYASAEWVPGRFLVVDEADRMLAQSYHNWISRLYESVFPPVDALDSTVMTTIRPRPQFGSCLGDFWLPMPKVDDHGEFDVSSVAKLPSVVPTTLRRFICSATLTTNPKKLALLALNRPQYFSTDRDVTVAASSEGQRPGTDIRSDNKGYKVPSGLSEAMLVCSLEDKVRALR
jgi:ATP-dependent RNA helicase DDX51/DBP6